MADKIQTRIAGLLPGLMASPALFVHDIDWDQATALVIEADRDFYRDAIFLDGRVLTEGLAGAHIPLGVLHKAIGAPPEAPQGPEVPPAHFIFHIGHTGSTLVSRLLDRVPGVLGLREPLILRGFARALNAEPAGEVFAQRLLGGYLLLARRFAGDQAVIIKATSMCCNLAPRLLDFNPGNRALALSVPLETYLAGLIEKPELLDVSGFAGDRLRGLGRRIKGFHLKAADLNKSELIAISWLAEMVELKRLAAGPLGDRVLFLDFDKFLQNRKAGLKKILSHFSLPAGALDGLVTSDVFASYAKQPGFAYSPDDRRLYLSTIRASHAGDIKHGLKFIEQLAARHPGVAAAVEFGTGI